MCTDFVSDYDAYSGFLIDIDHWCVQILLPIVTYTKEFKPSMFTTDHLDVNNDEYVRLSFNYHRIDDCEACIFKLIIIHVDEWN